jgi:predicted dienelactone hydrolase
MQTFVARHRSRLRALAGPALAMVLACGLADAGAAVGLADIAATPQDGKITLYYPTEAEAQSVKRGPFVLAVAPAAVPSPGNGRLVVISHGAGGSPWVHADLARALVDAGFVVALPEHHADNSRDDSDPGPDSWTVRPREVSRAIDAVGRDPRFAPLLDLDKVGVYGISAGGHTALSLAGGRWSPAAFVRHCEAHLVEDFPACVGLITHLTGSPLDGVRKWAALAVIRHRFADDTPRIDGDARIAAIVAGVPFAADFDISSLASPRVPLGLITARGDRWLAPRFHGDRVVQACRSCEHLADIAEGGHGALLSPLPPRLGGLVGELLNDPPGFDRPATTALVDAAVVGFFGRHLLQGKAAVRPLASLDQPAR